MRKTLLGILMALGIAACSEGPVDNKTIESNPTQAVMNEHPIAAPTAVTQYGKVEGYEEDGVLVFKGIRYGADTASTRFKPPKNPAPWTGVLQTKNYGNSTRQRTSSGISVFSSWRTDPAPALSEDCLFLNVWTPALDGAKRPVMVWLHGGGFSTGSGSSNAYDGVRLTNRGDVVVVTVNHRLNVFAHLYLSEYGDQFADSGNVGILDLVQSLKWVRDNIAAFGGDPDNVLIFGESGGGAKVSVLMAMDSAVGLFHRAVIQSGPQLTNTESATAAEFGAAVVTQLGLSKDNIDQILEIAPETIEQAVRDVVSIGTAYRFGPVFDQRSFLKQPFEPAAPTQSASVPLLIGTTRTEMSLLSGARRPVLFDLTWETLSDALEETMPGVNAAAIIEGYKALTPGIDAAELYFTATTDNGFLRRSRQLADRKADQGGAPVYAYLFDWDSPVDGGKWKSMHALEIGFVFDNVAKSESMAGLGSDQQAIADMMSESWLAFAKTGNPNNATLPDWTPYTSAERATMLINLKPKLAQDPRLNYLSLLGSEQ